jgi:N-acetyl-anhydromuramyl-L-alanine amidase AmpD
MNGYLKQMIEMIEFPEDQYYREKEDKKQICLHHSAGWDNARGMYNWFKSNREEVAVCLGIQDTGRIIQAYSSKYWAWHINVWSKGNQLPESFKNVRKPASWYEKHSIGVDVCNWGALQKRNGQYYAWPNNYGLRGEEVIVPSSKVVYYENGYRGHKYYERYTNEEIKSLYELCKLWMDKYEIPFTFKGRNFFEISHAAISGAKGIYSHSSYRTDKSDLHPQDELCEMLHRLSI